MKAFAFAIALSACATDPELGTTQQGLEEASWWSVGTTIEATPSWSSGKTKDLSSWKSIDCSQWSSQAVLRDLRVFKEPSSNADNFIARLDARCAEYTYACPNCGTAEVQSAYTTLFSGNYRTGSYALASTDSTWVQTQAFEYPETVFYPAGLTVGINPGHDYVQNVAIKTIAGDAYQPYETYWLANWWTSSTPWMIPDNGYEPGFGDSKSLSCGEGRVTTGLKLRYDVTNGKIRDLQLQCRALDFIEQ